MKKAIGFLACMMLLCMPLVSYGSDEASIKTTDDVSFDMSFDMSSVNADVVTFVVTVPSVDVNVECAHSSILDATVSLTALCIDYNFTAYVVTVEISIQPTTWEGYTTNDYNSNIGSNYVPVKPEGKPSYHVGKYHGNLNVTNGITNAKDVLYNDDHPLLMIC